MERSFFLFKILFIVLIADNYNFNALLILINTFEACKIYFSSWKDIGILVNFSLTITCLSKVSLIKHKFEANKNCVTYINKQDKRIMSTSKHLAVLFVHPFWGKRLTKIIESLMKRRYPIKFAIKLASLVSYHIK